MALLKIGALARRSPLHSDFPTLSLFFSTLQHKVQLLHLLTQKHFFRPFFPLAFVSLGVAGVLDLQLLTCSISFVTSHFPLPTERLRDRVSGQSSFSPTHVTALIKPCNFIPSKSHRLDRESSTSSLTLSTSISQTRVEHAVLDGLLHSLLNVLAWRNTQLLTSQSPMHACSSPSHIHCQTQCHNFHQRLRLTIWSLGQRA